VRCQRRNLDRQTCASPSTPQCAWLSSQLPLCRTRQEYLSLDMPGAQVVHQWVYKWRWLVEIKFRRDVYGRVNICVHSRKGIIATRPLSLGSPFHLGRTMEFSGCVSTCSGSVSSKITLDRSRFKYDKS